MDFLVVNVMVGGKGKIHRQNAIKDLPYVIQPAQLIFFLRELGDETILFEVQKATGDIYRHPAL
jgi:hypothetical protein